jgi:hypothetical protein
MIYIFDLNTLSVTQSFDLEEASGIKVIITPDEQNFYSYNKKSNFLIKYDVNDNDISEIDTLIIESSVVMFINWILEYVPEISPNGNNIVFQREDQLKIVDTDKMEVQCIIPSVEPFYDVAFTVDSKRLCLAHGPAKQFFTIIYLDGVNSYIENTVSISGRGGFAVEYNAIDNRFYLACRDYVFTVDPATGQIKDTININSESDVMQIGFDPEGMPIIMTREHFYYNDQKYSLRSPARRFKIDKDNQYCIFPSPGPDRVFILDFQTSGMSEIHVGRCELAVSIYPNPFSTSTTFSYTLEKPENIRFTVYNVQSGIVYERLEKQGKGEQKLRWNADGLTAGMYYFKLQAGDRYGSGKIVKVK